MGATWEAFFVSQDMVWFVQGLGWRLATGIMTFVGFIYLVKDLLTTSKIQFTKNKENIMFEPMTDLVPSFCNIKSRSININFISSHVY